MKESQEFKERKAILKLKTEFIKLDHKLKMERLEFDKKNIENFHDLSLQRERIKSAEIRKAQMRKEKGDAYRY
jgi:hypothetical protein|tara:strand:- start:2937 stop:3155 length:219 start_codon:yes stop_codon:yes gene_type:complete